MSKIYGLLDETTIINFRLLLKLSVRYALHLVIALIFFGSFSGYFYFKQSIIYSVSVPVKVADKPTVSTDMSSVLLPISSNSVSLSELSASVSSFTFLKSLAELIVKDPNFNHFNFGSMKNEKSLYGAEIKKVCKGNNTCIIEKLASSLDSFFVIEKGPTDNRFILTVNAIDTNTIEKMTDLVVSAIDLNRVKVRQYLVSKEIQSIGKLIQESSSMIKNMNGFNLLEEQGKLDNNILDTKEKVHLLQSAIGNEAGNVSTLEAQLEENKKSTLGSYAKGTAEYENMVKSQNKLISVRQDIIALSSIPEETRSSSDKQILLELQIEQTKLSKKLPREAHVKSIESSEAFKDTQFGKSSDFAFDHVVSKKKLAKLQEEYEATKILLNEMLQQKLNNESKVNGLNSDLDFLKNLEAKQMSLKLLNATMTSDLIFEDFSRETKEFRNSSYLKIILFSFSISIFLYMISILIRYSIDDTIYGEEEILSHFKSLDFIGEVPAFD